MDRPFPAFDWLTGAQLWVLLLLASLGDLLTTIYGLQLGAVEANPIAETAVTGYGWPSLALLKLGSLGLWWACLRRVPPRWRREALGVSVAYCSAIVCVNVAVIGRLLGIW